MKRDLLSKVIELKSKKKEFSIITDLQTAKNYVYDPDCKLDKDLEDFKINIKESFTNRKDGMIKDTNLFIKNYFRPIQVVIVGAVHIAQYFVEFAKNLNMEINIIDPRGYFASDKRFPDTNIINQWPKDAFKKISLNERTALIALTHDPKIDDPAIQEALKRKCFYIGALGSKNTHKNRCERLKENGFKDDEIQKIFGPIGIKFGGRSAPEIALSIIFQLMTEIYRK
ncbi:MAG: xanthine dehydrogenase [Candidatus Pelagibacter sp.]|nr:xanthine dehydrogenase [Candidatus Pelagibacter sp.]|tara:strand:+ start:5804 stop:6484 length:681 start_codon:yes stop_codon:yes gene_type:complete